MLEKQITRLCREDLRILRERGSLSGKVSCSESVIIVSRAFVADFELNLGAFSEFFDCNFLCILTFDFGQKMEVRI